MKRGSVEVSFLLMEESGNFHREESSGEEEGDQKRKRRDCRGRGRPGERGRRLEK